eukprot:10258540-Ditylum_brightwellii.AAC.1
MIEIDHGCNIRGNAEQIKERAQLMGLTLMKVADKIQEALLKRRTKRMRMTLLKKQHHFNT